MGFRASSVNLVIPIVPAAVIFDFALGNPRIRPTKDWSFDVCKSASDDPVELGNTGAELGATVGKILGPKTNDEEWFGILRYGASWGIKVGSRIRPKCF